MPPRDLTRYSNYFTLNIPGIMKEIAIIILLGILTGSVCSLWLHSGSGTNLNLFLLGASAGILVISFPALLTVGIMKVWKSKIKLKHSLFAVMVVSAAYAVFIIMDAALYSFLGNAAIAYLFLLLVNASIYGYWFIVNRIAIGQKKGAIITAEIQPILNVLLYLPFGKYLLQPVFSASATLLRLFAGMFIFLIMGYIIIYLLDRPAKKNLSISSVDLFTSMVNNWLYDVATDPKILGKGGVKRDVEVEVASLSANGRTKAIFVKPDIHYGPFGGVGGSVFTQNIGEMIVSKYRSAPFVIHSAVNIEDNPMNTNQVYELSRRICKYVELLERSKGNEAYGSLGFGKDGPCRAMNMQINDLNILLLSKAPFVTEDIDREVGLGFAELANRDGRSTMLIDAHNSRFESAGVEELKGIGKGSSYIERYSRAIIQATRKSRMKRMRFGSAYANFFKTATKPDMGPGYSSVGIFEFGKKRFGMLYFDANNMLPGFRSSIIEHVKEKYGLDIELCTTDTHAVNSLALSAKNALGRYTAPKEVMPVVDQMVEKAMAGMEPVRISRGTLKFEGFRIWGNGSEELLNKVGMDIIKIGKRIVPFVIVAAYIIAGWIIYII